MVFVNYFEKVSICIPFNAVHSIVEHGLFSGEQSPHTSPFTLHVIFIFWTFTVLVAKY